MMSDDKLNDPTAQELFYGVFYGEKIGWLFDDDVDRRTIARRVARTHHDGSGRGAQFNDMCHLAAGHASHRVVRQNQVMQSRVEPGQRLGRGLGGIHLISKIVKEHFGEQTRIIVVVDDQYGSQLRF